MKTSPGHLLYRVTAACIMITLAAVTAACTSLYEPPPQTDQETSEPVTESSAPKLQTLSGTIAAIKDKTLTLTTAEGPATVNIGADTAIAKAAPGAVSDLAPGQLLIITGTPDSSGNVAAANIAIRPQPQSAPLPAPEDGSYVGILTTLNSNTLTITTAQINPVQAHVNFTARTAVQKTAAGAITDLAVGHKLTVFGNAGDHDAIDAVSIIDG